MAAPSGFAKSTSPKTLRGFVLLALSACFILLAGCIFVPSKRYDRSSSIAEYLYPRDDVPTFPPGLPVLKLPLRVGIAFVPKDSISGSGHHRETMTELQTTQLLHRVADSFRTQEFIADIQIISSTYLRPRGSFENLHQLKRMLNLDVIALVSYDQVQFTDDNRLSLSYLTIVGAYLFKGNRNDTQTLMEAAVYDISSRQLLFRAPGGSHVSASSTLHQLDEKLRRDSGYSLQQATDEMIVNLQAQLAEFKIRAKDAPGTIATIEHRPGYRGGDLGHVFIVMLLAIFCRASLRPHLGESRPSAQPSVK